MLSIKIRFAFNKRQAKIILWGIVMNRNDFLYNKRHRRRGRLTAVLAAAVLACSLVGCQADVDTGQADTEQTVQGTQQTAETTARQTEQLIKEIETTSDSTIETETEKNNDINRVFTIDSDVYPLDSEEITIRVDTSMYAYGNFQYNYIDLENLKNYSNLKRLSISSYNDAEVHDPIKLINCGSIASLNNLEELTLDMVEFDGDWLSEISSLKTLDIQWCKLNWNFLHDLSQVETLILYRCDITELDFINDMKSLSELSLSNIGIEKFEIAEENNSVKRLLLNENAFTDISGIDMLCNLEYLYVSETHLDDYENQINELKASLPMCEINI